MTQQEMFGVSGDKMLFALLSRAKEKGCPEEWINQFWEEFKAWEYAGPKVKLVNESRRWEVVSAFQKAIRRGLPDVATRMGTAMCSSNSPEIMGHLWRRITVISMEDVGFGNEPLMAFCFIAYDVFSKKANLMVSQPMAMFLLHALASSNLKDRSICDMAVIRSIVGEVHSKPAERERIHALNDTVHQYIDMAMESTDYQSDVAWETWLSKERTKSLDMSDVYLATKLLVKSQGHGIVDNGPGPTYAMIKGMPSFCYDMYTRSGKRALARFSAMQVMQSGLNALGITSNHVDVVGWAQFYLESGHLNREYTSVVRSDLRFASKSVAAAHLGVAYEQLIAAQQLVSANLPLLNQCRTLATQTY